MNTPKLNPDLFRVESPEEPGTVEGSLAAFNQLIRRDPHPELPPYILSFARKMHDHLIPDTRDDWKAIPPIQFYPGMTEKIRAIWSMRGRPDESKAMASIAIGLACECLMLADACGEVEG